MAQQNQLLDKRLAAGESVFVDTTDAEEGAVRPGRADRRHGRPGVALRFTTRVDVRRERDWLRPSDLRAPDRVLD